MITPPKTNTANAETELTASHTDVIIFKKRCNIIMLIKISPVITKNIVGRVFLLSLS